MLCDKRKKADEGEGAPNTAAADGIAPVRTGNKPSDDPAAEIAAAEKSAKDGKSDVRDAPVSSPRDKRAPRSRSRERDRRRSSPAR